MDVICEGVRRECRRAPVVLFQILIVASLVPPPEAKREGCQGHQAIAYVVTNIVRNRFLIKGVVDLPSQLQCGFVWSILRCLGHLRLHLPAFHPRYLQRCRCLH